MHSASGTDLAMLVNIPDGRGARSPYPGVVVLHGLGGFKESPRLSGLAEALAIAGFVALRLDATGMGESDGEHPERFRMESYRNDIDAAVGALAKRADVDANRLGICGHSLGGLLSVIAASEDTRLRAVCPISAPDAVMNSWGRSQLPQWRERGWFEKYNPHQGNIRIPISFMDGTDRWDPVDAAVRVNAPTLVIAGDEDEVVPPGESRRIFEALAGERQWRCLSGIGHNYKDPPEIALVNGHVVEFFLRTIGVADERPSE